jgi:hypothetical protein
MYFNKTISRDSLKTEDAIYLSDTDFPQSMNDNPF